MPDYYALMTRALAKLERNTADDRRVLFDRARAVLLKQLRNRRPPATEPEVKREQFALEVAIRKVELELATAVVRSTSSAIVPPKGERAVVQNPVEEAQLRGRISELLGGDKSELFNPADPSNFMQITTHMWLDHLMKDAKLPIAREGLKRDADTVLKWLGVKSPEDIGTEHHQRWARGFEQYLMEGKVPSASLARSFNFFRLQLQRINRSPHEVGEPITDDMRAVYDRMLATDEEIADFRSAYDAPPTAPQQSEQPDKPVHTSRPDQAWAFATATPRLKGILGFAAGFVLIFGLEALLFGGVEILSAHRPRPIGLGWIIMPFAAGCAGWIVFRKVDFTKAARLKDLFAELRSWPREHQVALAIAFAIGWIVAVVIGFFMSISGTPAYYPPKFGTWLLGSSEYFPWASLLSGLAGGIVGAAIIYVRQLLRIGDERSAARRISL
jgi:hypothetical protein